METTNNHGDAAFRPVSRAPRRLLHALYYILMLAFVVFYMLPFWGTLTTSLKSNAEVMTSTAVELPREVTAEGYVNAFEALKVPLINSLYDHGIDQFDKSFSNVEHDESFQYANLGSSQSSPVRMIHSFSHIFKQGANPAVDVINTPCFFS